MNIIGKKRRKFRLDKCLNVWNIFVKFLEIRRIINYLMQYNLRRFKIFSLYIL